jgi:hypothetical protein
VESTHDNDTVSVFGFVVYVPDIDTILLQKVEVTSTPGELLPLRGLNQPAYQQVITATPAYPRNVGQEEEVITEQIGVAAQAKPDTGDPNRIYRCPDPECGEEFKWEYLLQRMSIN